jgi:predicted acyltransferase (DUF342 family)
MGYVLLVAGFAALVSVCFLPAIVELRRPKDPGPLPIDPKRDISERHFALAMRDRATAVTTRGPLVFDGDLRVAPRSLHDCELLVTGDATIGEGSRVHSVVAEGMLHLAAGVRIDSHAEGVRGLVVGPGASVHGRATSPNQIVLASGVRVAHVAAPLISVAGAAQVAAPATQAEWTDELAAAFERLFPMGFEAALRRMAFSSGAEPSGLDALAHIARRGLITTDVADLHAVLGLSWLGSLRGWYLGAGTVRVRGDLVLPQGALVPFHLIVEGDLAAGPGSHLHGGVYTEGDVYLGPGSVVRGSVTARGDVRMGPRTWVGMCVAAGAHAEIGASCSIGGERSGGLTAEGHIVLAEGVAVRNKLFALAGVSTLAPAPVS